uniref:M56 family metallopeptidase n=1 Tax=Agathobacter sp. TaxID=2021311 RepID=UPI0040568C36
MNELYLKIISMSLSASWLVPAVLILRLVLKKAPKWIHVLLWGIVAVRLICPFTLESSVSLIPDSVGSGELVTEWADDYIDDIDIYTPDSIYYDAAVGAGREPISDGEGGYYVVTKHDQLGEPATIYNTVIPVLSVVWFIGMAILVLYTVISYWRLHSKLNTAIRYKDNIFQSENVNSPFVLGIIKPKIYLPFHMDGQDMEHVIAHERAHLKRKDHLWKPLGFLLLTIHWFNPLMWLAYILLCRDIELACDEKVIKELGNEQKADYTQALVSCSVNRRMIAACPLAFGEVGVKERVKSVMNYKKPAFWVILVSVIACIVIAVCFLTNPKQDSYTLRIVVPAGSQEEFVYSDEEISTIKSSIKIWSGDGLGDTEVLLSPVNETTEAGYTATYLTHGMPVEFDAEKDTWFKVGVNMQNRTDKDLIVYVKVENVEVRISDESTPDSIAFKAEVLEIHDGYFLVKPESGWAINSADQIEVPMENMDPSLEPQVGDIIEITYDGKILETYPARLSNVYSIKVVEEAMSVTSESDTWDFSDVASIQVINGNNGECVTFVKGTTKPDFQKILDLCQNLEKSTDSEENSRVGYNYCVVMYDDNSQKLHSITPYKDGCTVDDTFYNYSDTDTNIYDNASVKLLDYLGLLFYPAEDTSELIENSLLTTTEFTEEVNILANVEIQIAEYNSTGGSLEITNHSGKELTTGEQVDIQINSDGKWYRIEQIYDALWEEVAYKLPDEQTTTLTIQWSFMYGKLPAGSYRIVKEVTDYRAPGDYDTYYLAAEFEIK